MQFKRRRGAKERPIFLEKRKAQCMNESAFPIDNRIRNSIVGAHDALARKGDLMPEERLSSSYATFRERFGPAKLKSMDGEALLIYMHAHGNKESLVYWLEFKNDEEFPG